MPDGGRHICEGVWNVNGGFVKTMETIFKPIANPVITRVLKPLRDAKKLPGIAIKKIQTAFKALLNTKEASLANYVAIGRYYVSKRLLAYTCLGLLIVSFFLFIRPTPLVKKWFYPIPTLREASPKAASYSGNAKVLAATAETLRYKGELKDGQYAGQGKLYNDAGTLIYEGEFDKGQKAGTGTLYDDKGTLLYKGQFAADTMNGQGMTFYPDGKILYFGEFQNGKIGGAGKMFYPSGDLKYEGAFSAGSYGGEGKQYNEAGTLVYEGGFAAGEYSGPGKLYAGKNVLLYEGNFKNGRYSGEGTEYYASGFVKYKGQFQAGAYNGEGATFSEAGVPVLKGTFANGAANGAGEAYGKDGKTIYKGDFKNGLYEGVGTLLDPDGAPVVKSFFAQGHLNLQGFLGLSSQKVEEMLGKPTEVALADGAAPLAGADAGTEAAGTGTGGATATATPAATPSGTAKTAAGTVKAASSGVSGAEPAGKATAGGTAAPTPSPAAGAAAAVGDIVKLVMNFNDQQLSFTIETTPANPKEAIVTGMTLWGSKALAAIAPEIETFANPDKPNALGYNTLELHKDAGSDTYLNTYYKDDFLFTFTHYRKSGAANQLEISAVNAK